MKALPPVNAAESKRPRPFFPAWKAFRRSALTVGVDLSPNAIHLVKIEHRNRKKPKLVDFHTIDRPSDLSENLEASADLLRKALARICPGSPPPRIWTAAALEETDVRFLRVPRVSGPKLENAVNWTYQKDAPFDTEHTLLDFRVLGTTADNGVTKIEVLACTASRSHVTELKKLFRSAGYELSGVIAPSFGFQNYVKAGWCPAGAPLACNLVIDFNWSRIDIVRANGDLIVSRGIKAGIASMIESIRNETPPPPGNGRSVDDSGRETTVLELSVFDAFDADQVLQLLNPDAPAASRGAGGVLRDEEVFDMVLPALERLVRQVERTLEHVTLRYSDGPITRILFSGPITAYPRIVTYMAGQLDLPADTVDPFASVPSGFKQPGTASERARYIAPAGLALSDAAAPPNFLRTRREQGEQRRTRGVRAAFLCCFLIAAGVIWGYHLTQQKRVHRLEDKLARLTLAAGAPETVQDGPSLLAAVAAVNRRHQLQKAQVKKYLPAALIGEITSLAPAQVRFIRIEGRVSEPRDTATEAARGSAAPVTVVDAVIYGTSADAEATLARYLLRLKRSPVIQGVSLREKAYQQRDSQQVLRFFLSLEGD